MFKKPEIPSNEELERVVLEAHDKLKPYGKAFYQAGIDYCYKDMLKQFVKLLEDNLEDSFVMAYVGEDEPYESTIDPITIRELIQSLKAQLEEL